MIVIDKCEVVKFVDGEFELEVNVSPKENTVWLTIEQISILFDRDRSVISKHIKNVFNEGELKENLVCAYFAHTATDGKRYKVKYYNLDMVISTGYRVKSKRGILFRCWANNILREYLLKGYVINENRVTVSNENYIELKNEVTSINNRLLKIEDKVLDKEYKVNKIFFNGEFYDSYTLIQQIFESASSEVIIIDNYIDRSIIDRLVVKANNVNVVIYTNKSSCKLIESDILKFNSQYGKLTIKYTKNVHDRYIIIDSAKLYHVGHSLKDLGKKIFSISELESSFIKTLLCNIEEI